MAKKWKGIKEIVEKATKDLVETKENGFLYYSAPKGYKLFLSVVTIAPSTVRFEIKDIGISISGRKDEIVRRGLSETEGRMITDEDEPLLELIENRDMEAEEVLKHIKEERRKARYRVQGRMFP